MGNRCEAPVVTRAFVSRLVDNRQWGLAMSDRSRLPKSLRMSEEKKRVEIKLARGRVKGSLTRLENGADDLNLKNEILIRLQSLEELIVDFERLDLELTL
ncbi:hypothetical protein TNCV_2309931 [Trichonephila clavipes]|nr:hypothetical protein TNCV_2309931 [Trichonephila clavipes]